MPSSSINLSVTITKKEHEVIIPKISIFCAVLLLGSLSQTTAQVTMQVGGAPAPRVQVGQPMPDFRFENIDDSTQKVGPTSLRGSWVLIDNWATWCGPCVREMDALHNAYNSFRGKKFIILSVSFDRQKADVLKFRADKWHMPWLNCFSPGVWQNDAVKIMGIQSIPKPILVDPNGVVVAMDIDLRGDNLERTLAKFIQ